MRRAIAGSLACALAAACLSAPNAAAADGQSPADASVLVVPPARIDRAVREIDAIARDVLRKTGVPGMSIAIVHDDRVVYLKGFGVRRAGRAARVDPDTIFELASLSKPLGAAVVAGAAGRGCVQWTDPVATYLPHFTLSDAYAGQTVTIADMYAHRSGLPDHAGDLLEDLGYDRTTILERLAREPLDPFRITYHYTNFGLTAAAQAVANACGTTWEALSHDVLYAPLGMRATSSRFADYAHAPNHADLHVRTARGWQPRFVRDADAQSPAGGASSSARDMARFLRLELGAGTFAGKRVVDRDALLQTRAPNLMSSPLATPTSRASFYGLGMGVSYDAAGRLRLSHSGAFASGAATTIVMLPSERLGIVVLTNGAPVGAPEAIAADFMDLAEVGSITFDWLTGYGALMKHLSDNPSVLAAKARPPRPAAARGLAAFEGIYANAYYGPATVARRGDGLELTLGPRHMRFTLTHWAGDTFSYEPTGENAVGISAVSFSVAAGSRVARTMRIENLDANKLGTFTRRTP